MPSKVFAHLLPFLLAAPIPPLKDHVVLQGLEAPTAVRFATTGEIFVAEKSGRILRFENLEDENPDLVADLSDNVFDFWDRGLLGLAIDPAYPAQRNLYVLYTVDAPPGENPPFWHDTCPSPPGSLQDGCLATGRLSRLELQPGEGSGSASEVVLIGNAFCQQFPSHSIGDLAFGPGGALYLSAGDGASFNQTDYGQLGGSLSGTPTPRNACGDPPAGTGGLQIPPSAEGGALRSQDFRTKGDPLGFDGSLLRLSEFADPDGGGHGGDKVEILAYGLRNPYRFTFDGAGNTWIGDVGWNAAEEINHLDPARGSVANFGWPCYEGNDRQLDYDALDLDLCETLYANPAAVTPPYFAYPHDLPLGDAACGGAGSQSAISGLAFYHGANYPQPLHGALFFADYGRRCIWALPPGENGLPDPGRLVTISSAAGAVVDLVAGPDGDLFYLDIEEGTLHRITFESGIFADGFESGDTGNWSQ